MKYWMISWALLTGFVNHSGGQTVNWTHFRGSQLNGISTETGFPVEWNDSSQVVWRTEIPGRGWSSPVVFASQVWCTTATPDGKEMFAVCLDFQTGKEIFNIKVFEPDTVFRKHAINSYATPTPCIEDGYLYVHFGRYGTACIHTGSGEILWTRKDLRCKHVQGPGSSPVLYGDLLILHMEGTDVRYLVALDKKTGETVWKTDRPLEPFEKLAEIGRKAYITPKIIRVDGKDLLLSNGSAVCIAYEPQTGREVWRVVEGAESTVAMPLEGDDLVYFFTGHESYPDGDFSELLAVDPHGQGDVTGTHVRWRLRTPPLQLPTPVLRKGLIYTIDSRANMFCLDASTGETVWTKKLKGKFNSSLLWADGNIYFSSTDGETYVIREGRAFDLVSVNALEGEIWATPALVRGSILVRTSRYLYRIGHIE
jgi:outer membrane protein assembly factor BamB